MQKLRNKQKHTRAHTDTFKQENTQTHKNSHKPLHFTSGYAYCMLVCEIFLCVCVCVYVFVCVIIRGIRFNFVDTLLFRFYWCLSIAVYCRLWQWVAMSFNVLHCVTVCDRVWQFFFWCMIFADLLIPVCCSVFHLKSVLHCVVMGCSVM